jgi:hypothetical protein
MEGSSRVFLTYCQRNRNSALIQDTKEWGTRDNAYGQWANVAYKGQKETWAKNHHGQWANGNMSQGSPWAMGKWKHEPRISMGNGQMETWAKDQHGQWANGNISQGSPWAMGKWGSPWAMGKWLHGTKDKGQTSSKRNHGYYQGLRNTHGSRGPRRCLMNVMNTNPWTID